MQLEKRIHCLSLLDSGLLDNRKGLDKVGERKKVPTCKSEFANYTPVHLPNPLSCHEKQWNWILYLPMHYKVSDTLELQGGDNEVLFQTMHTAVEAFDRHARRCNGMQYWLAGIDSGHQVHQGSIFDTATLCSMLIWSRNIQTWSLVVDVSTKCRWWRVPSILYGQKAILIWQLFSALSSI